MPHPQSVLLRSPAGRPGISPTEAQLLRSLRRGTPEAYEELVRRQAGRMLAVARRILRDDEEEARDAVQEAFVAVVRRLESFQGDCQLSTWLYRVTVNAALMRLRARRRRPESSLEELLPRFFADGCRDDSSDAVLPEAITHSAQVRRVVRTAIDELPDSYRTVLLLRDIDERSTAEAAELLGISSLAVKLRLHRARQALRQRLIDRRQELIG